MIARFHKTRKRGSWQNTLFSLVLGMMALGLIGFLAISNWKIAANRRAIERQTADLTNQIRELEDRRGTLEAGLDAARQNDFQEEKIRDQGYKKPGEEVIAVLQSKSQEEQQAQEQTDSFWSKIWQTISGGKD